MARRAMAVPLAVLVGAAATVTCPALGTQPAQAAPLRARVPVKICTTEQWQADFRACVEKLEEVTEARAQCLTPPTPGAPDSGLAGWFAGRPDSSKLPG